LGKDGKTIAVVEAKRTSKEAAFIEHMPNEVSKKINFKTDNTLSSREVQFFDCVDLMFLYREDLWIIH
jgi:hypothetical protein